MKTSVLILVVVLSLAGGFAGSYLGRLGTSDPGVARGPSRDSSGTRALEEIASLRAEMVTMLRERANRDAATPPDPLIEKSAPEGSLPSESARPGSMEVPPEKSPPADPLDGILGKPFTWNASGRLFMRLMSKPEQIDGAIARIKTEIEKNPNNPDLQVMLASAWTSKTATMTPGPAQGTTWREASKAYDKAIELEPEHWQARYGKAFGLSMAPEFVGMRPEAIKQFEVLLPIQESQVAQPEHAQSYFRLGTLYKDAGNPDKARQVWERGRKFFPDDKQITEALAVIEKR